MTQTLKDVLSGARNKNFAAQTGTYMHAVLQHVVVDRVAGNTGNPEIVDVISSRPDLKPFFVKNAKTEVPIAGYINGCLISRRIDRMVIKHDEKTIDFIDYKTDTDKTMFIEQYKHQLNEYLKLLHSVYPDYKIKGYILWLNDWQLEPLVCNKKS